MKLSCQRRSKQAIRAACLLAAQVFVLDALKPSKAAGDETTATADMIPNQAAVLDEMAAAIQAAVRRADTTHPIFHGCFDWHSAVHGHWALLRIAAATSRHDEEAQWVVAALDPQRLAAEADYLRTHPGFEMPYGRAWFLRLVIEYESRPHAADQPGAVVLADMADQVAASLWQFCQSRPQSPESREYDNDAWALVQLHEFYSHKHDEPQRQKIAARIKEFFADSRSPVRFEVDRDNSDFFSRFGNWAYVVSKTQPPADVRRFWQAHLPTDDELRPVQPRPGRAHHLGTNWSRAWALRAVRRRLADPAEQSRLHDAYLQHVAAGLATHAEYKDNYGAYGHWVPQFAVYAITE
jgi:hypothetical protein